MKCSGFNLPEIQIVGGSFEQFKAKLATTSGDAFSAIGARVYFSLIPYSHQHTQPILQKQATVSEGSGGFFYAEFTLAPEDTVGLHDTYIYQFTVIGADGAIDPSNQGLLHVQRNIDPALCL